VFALKRGVGATIKGETKPVGEKKFPHKDVGAWVRTISSKKRRGSLKKKV